MNRRSFLQRVGLSSLSAAVSFLGFGEPEAEATTAGIGTYLRVDASRPERVPVSGVNKILGNPGVVGFLINQGWSDIEPSPGGFDYRTAAVAAQLARDHAVEFHWRIVAGAHTPVFHMGSTWVPVGGLAAGMTLPCPFTPAGRINRVFLNGYRTLTTGAGGWAAANGITGYHASHWGGKSAELNVIAEIANVPGYNAALILNAHLKLLAAVQALPSTVPFIEFPISGFAPKGFTTAFADAMRAVVRPSYLSMNFLSDRTDPTPLVNWPYGATPLHNVQMIHEEPPVPRTGTWDWAQVYANAKLSGAQNVEVYYRSFFMPDGSLDAALLAEIAKAAAG